MEITEDERATNNNGRFERQDRKLQILKDNHTALKLNVNVGCRIKKINGLMKILRL